MADNNEHIEENSVEEEYTFPPISPELRADIDGKHAVEKLLEEKYASRGLKFTAGFGGSYPVQAWGIIDDYRFYFRFRHDSASIRIGFIAEDRLAREYQRDMKFHAERMARLDKEEAETGIVDDSVFAMLYRQEPVLEELNGIDDYPSSIRKQAYWGNIYDDEYKGHLNPEECETIFTHLIENLAEVEYEDPITIEL